MLEIDFTPIEVTRRPTGQEMFEALFKSIKDAPEEFRPKPKLREVHVSEYDAKQITRVTGRAQNYACHLDLFPEQLKKHGLVSDVIYFLEVILGLTPEQYSVVLHSHPANELCHFRSDCKKVENP